MPEPSDETLPDTIDLAPTVLTFRILGGDLSLAQEVVESDDTSLTTSESVQFSGVDYWRESLKVEHFGPDQVLTFSVEVGKDVGAGLLAAWLYDRLKDTDIEKIEMDVRNSDKFERISVQRAELKEAIEKWLRNKD